MYVSSSSSFGSVLTTQLGVILLQDPRYPLVCQAVSLLTRSKWTTMVTRTLLRGHAYTEILIEEQSARGIGPLGRPELIGCSSLSIHKCFNAPPASQANPSDARDNQGKGLGCQQ